MNAYELADKFNWIFKEANSLIKKQEHRIKELEKEKKERALQRLSDFTQEADAEPVAWMETYKGEPNNLDWDKNNLNYGDDLHDVVPLYTTPHTDKWKAKVTRAYDNGFFDGQKALRGDSEPVAWMYQDNVTDEWEFSSMKVAGNCEPLYRTPQAKPRLSNEEIEETIDNCFGIHAFNLDYEWTLDEVRANAMLLSRAIEERILGK